MGWEMKSIRERFHSGIKRGMKKMTVACLIDWEKAFKAFRLLRSLETRAE